MGIRFLRARHVPRRFLSLPLHQSPQTSPPSTPEAAAAPGPIPSASPISSYPRAPRARPSAHSSSQESVPPELRGPGIFVSRTPRPSRTPAVPLSISKRRSSSTSSRTRSVESSAIVITGESNQRHRKPQFVVKQIPPGQEAHLAGSPSHYVSHQ